MKSLRCTHGSSSMVIGAHRMPICSHLPKERSRVRARPSLHGSYSQMQPDFVWRDPQYWTDIALEHRLESLACKLSNYRTSLITDHIITCVSTESWGFLCMFHTRPLTSMGGEFCWPLSLHIRFISIYC